MGSKLLCQHGLNGSVERASVDGKKERKEERFGKLYELYFSFGMLEVGILLHSRSRL